MSVIRRASPADADAALALTRRAYARWVPVIGREPQPMTTDYHAAIRDEHVDLLEEEGALVGLIHLVAGPDHLLIYNVAVDPEAQGRGHGRQLLAHAEQVARDRGHATLQLFTNVKFGENIRLYERLGYRTDRLDASSGFARVYMSKRLPPAG